MPGIHPAPAGHCRKCRRLGQFDRIVVVAAVGAFQHIVRKDRLHTVRIQRNVHQVVAHDCGRGTHDTVHTGVIFCWQPGSLSGCGIAAAHLYWPLMTRLVVAEPASKVACHQVWCLRPARRRRRCSSPTPFTVICVTTLCVVVFAYLNRETEACSDRTDRTGSRSTAFG
jgi:hypothetical protein